jgi:excisionase family DNA binding protein
MTDSARDPLLEFARSLPAALDDSALHELAVRLRPFLAETDSEQPGDRLYTAAETAQQIGVNVETVRRAIRSGDLQVAALIGRSPRLSRDAIDRWLAGTVEIMTEAGPRRRRRRRRQSVLTEHSLRAAFKTGS